MNQDKRPGWLTMEMVNLTPHRVVLRRADGGDVVVDPSGVVARCATPAQTKGDEGLPVPVIRQGTLGPVEGLPATKPGTVFIVSGLVLGHPSVGGRRDVLAPATGPQDGAIRNEKGQVTAVTALLGRND